MDEEFMNTLRNIGTKWYQCPKGHAYTIGECGLAMIESICPECGERIGGRDHQLLKTNKLVDFDLDVKNNINITPVKVIHKKDSEKKEEEGKKDNDKREKEEKKEKEGEKDIDKIEKDENKGKKENKEKEENKENDKIQNGEKKGNKEDKINDLTKKEK